MINVIKVMENEVGTTTRSVAVPSCKKVGLYFVRTDHASGNTVFSVGISAQPQDTVIPTYATCNMLVANVTNTNTQNITRVASQTLSANGGAYVSLDPSMIVTFLQVTATVTTDGKSSAYLVYEDNL